VILANTIAYLVSRSLQPHSIFEVFTHQDGLDLPSMEEQREEVVLHLEDALRPLSVPVIEAGATVSAANAELEAKKADAFLVKLPGHAWYSMTRAELAGGRLRARSPLRMCSRATRPHKDGVAHWGDAFVLADVTR